MQLKANQRRAWLALRDRGCDTFALTIGNEPRARDGVDSGDAASAIEYCIVRAGGKVGSDTLLAVESAAHFETFGNTGVGDAFGAIEGESILADGLGNTDTHASLEPGSNFAVPSHRSGAAAGSVRDSIDGEIASGGQPAASSITHFSVSTSSSDPGGQLGFSDKLYFVVLGLKLLPLGQEGANSDTQSPAFRILPSSQPGPETEAHTLKRS
ncbi:hypothetical protein BELL_0636g00040 [Botrytis elliptica]|uniref:Uncharacterized protein n=1 Tax=Botrytis elliptica TaxID=278938 RepID=A0A4Z1JB81_9HELO|nr:hypothetical protein EAE99_010633 [Botrytis elliptica]TGO70981.1 hypothetical protein BELL_0636g00040 [Botrytis elliptica]